MFDSLTCMISIYFFFRNHKLKEIYFNIHDNNFINQDEVIQSSKQ